MVATFEAIVVSNHISRMYLPKSKSLSKSGSTIFDFDLDFDYNNAKIRRFRLDRSLS